MIVSSSQDAIKRVVEAFERSDWAEIDVRSGNLRVHLVLRADHDAARTSTARSRGESVERHPTDPATIAQYRDTRPDRRRCGEPAAAGTHLVVSPSPGILWRSPEPGLPPFADLGEIVDASATVCIVEVMKLMNHVKAGVSGEVVAVYGENGVAVQKGRDTVCDHSIRAVA